MAWRKESTGGVRRGVGMAALGLALLATVACNSSKSSQSEEKSGVGEKPAAAQSGPTLDLNCVIDHIQNPTEAFHYSYKKDSSYPVQEEADITPQTIAGTFTNSGGTHPVNGTRADADSWHAAWAGLTGISGMSSTIALVRNGSAMVQEGTEQVNGYATTKYSIDTALGDAAEQGLYRSTLGNGGFEKGTVWVTAQGCPAKMSIDSEMHANDGSVEKIHYEESMVKK